MDDDEFSLKLDTDDIIVRIACYIATPISEETLKEIENITVNKDKKDALLSKSRIIPRVDDGAMKVNIEKDSKEEIQ
jgi:hypothetical protein